jgi:hypothetical protein
MAMAKPDVMATQFVSAAGVPSAANAAGASKQMARTASRNNAYLFMVFSSL